MNNAFTDVWLQINSNIQNTSRSNYSLLRKEAKDNHNSTKTTLAND